MPAIKNIPGLMTPDRRRSTRRQWLKGSLTVGGTILLGFHNVPLNGLSTFEGSPASSESRYLGLVEFIGEGQLPMDTLLDSGLDGRLYTNLSAVSPANLETPNERFFVRTRASDLLKGDKPWAIKAGGLIKEPAQISITDLQRKSIPLGLRLLECSGNIRYGHFGMISVADWTGVPAEKVLDSIRTERKSTRVLISGFDQYPFPSDTSLPGASWIFTLEDLTSAKAFFATGMNGAPLSRDHGAPVRLVVPGWYGCVSVKWVNEIRFVDEAAAATSQMQEFAIRTMQDGIPELAKDYRPAVVDQAAMPVRVEKWLADQKIKYRVTGIAWGGNRLLKQLEIRFSPSEKFVAVDEFQHTTNDPWTIWTHWWVPARPGVYFIQLRVPDTSVAARRMDRGYYVRSVEIKET